MLFAENVIGIINGEFWVEGRLEKTQMHFRFNTTLDQAKKDDLLQLSTTGRNEAKPGFVNLVREAIMKGDSNEGRKMVSYSGYIQDLEDPEEDLEMRMLTGLADDIKVSIWRGIAEITCVKRIIIKKNRRR